MVSGIVLAGGASRRMGHDKAWTELAGQPLVVRVIKALRPVCDEIIIVTNRPAGYEELNVRLVGDEIANTGSLGGLYSGLSAAQNDKAVAVACDMPFLNPALLGLLITLSSNNDVIIPSVHDQPSVRDDRKSPPEDNRPDTAKKLSLHPLHAVYRKTCLVPMRDAIGRGDLRMIAFHDAVRVHVVEQKEIEKFDPQHYSFWNVNTPEELDRAEQFVSVQAEGANHA